MTFAPGRGDVPGGPGRGAAAVVDAGRGRRAGRHDAADTPAADPPAPASTQNQPDRAPRAPVSVQIDFDGLSQRILAIPGVADARILEAEGGRRRNGLLPAGGRAP